MHELSWLELIVMKSESDFHIGYDQFSLNLTNKVSLIWSLVWQPRFNLIIWQVFSRINNYFRSTNNYFRHLKRWQTWRVGWRRLNVLMAASGMQERMWWSSWQDGKHPGPNAARQVQLLFFIWQIQKQRQRNRQRQRQRQRGVLVQIQTGRCQCSSSSPS